MDTAQRQMVDFIADQGDSRSRANPQASRTLAHALKLIYKRERGCRHAAILDGPLCHLQSLRACSGVSSFSFMTYRDGYREVLMEIIEAKLGGQEIEGARPAPGQAR